MTDENPTARALRGFLAERPVTGLWTEAMTLELPLLSSRRGTRDQWQEYGLEFHRVVMKPLWLARWTGEMLGRGADFGGTIHGGAALMRDLLAMPGVDNVHNVVAFHEPGVTHRLSGWVRIDHQVWPVQVPEELTKRVENPWLP